MKLPDGHVQDTVRAVLEDVRAGKVPEDSFWAEIDHEHFTIDVQTSSRNSNNLDLHTSSGIPVALNDDVLHIGDHQFLLGTQTLRLGSKASRISCGDVLNDQVVLGGTDGSLRLYDANGDSTSGASRMIAEYEGHLLHTSVAKFFPSGQVLLSAGMDYSLKIWDAGTGTLAQTLRKQRGLVEAVEIIERGRNIVSLCPADSSAILWEVGGGQAIHSTTVPGASTMTLTKGTHTSETYPDGPNEYGVSGKSVLLGTSHSVTMWDFRTTPSPLVTADGSASLATSGNLIAYSGDSCIKVVDIRNPQASLVEIEDSASALCFSQDATALFLKTSSGVYGVPLGQDPPHIVATDPTTLALTATSDKRLWTLGQSVFSYRG